MQNLGPILVLAFSYCGVSGCRLMLPQTSETTAQPAVLTDSSELGPSKESKPLPSEVPVRLPSTEDYEATKLVRFDEEELPVPESESTQVDRRPDPAQKKVTNDPLSQVEDGMEGGMPLSIEECRAAALQGNLDLNIARMDPQITSQGVRAQNWKFEPFLSGGISQNNIAPPPGNFSLGGPPPERLLDVFQPAINFPTPTGGTVSLTGTRDRLDLLPSGSVAGFPIFDKSAGLSLTQPLLRGGWFPANFASIRVARMENGIADAQARLTSVIVLVNIENAYWPLYSAQQQVRIAEQQLDFAQRQLVMARRLAEEKVIAQIEVLRSESGVALRREALIVAQTQVKLRSRELKLVMQRPDLPVDSPVVLVPTTAPDPFDVRLDRKTLEQYALTNRMDLRQNGFALDINDQAIVLARNGVLPNIQLQYVTRLLGSGASSGAADASLRSGDFRDSFLGITGEIPLAANQSAIARLRQAQLTKSRTGIVRRQLEVTIVKQVNDAVDRLEQNWQRVEAARRAVEAAEKTYRAEQRLFDLGQRAGDLVLDAAARLALAQEQLVLAVSDFMIARAELAFATGSMLGYGGIVWDTRPGQPLQPAAFPSGL